MDLSKILSDRDFGLQMRFVKGDVASFFMPGTKHADVVAERQRWLASDTNRYCAMMPEAEGLLDETIQIALSSGTLLNGESTADFMALDPHSRCRYLGERWEADFLLMKPDPEGVFRLYGGCLCFPSHWDLRAKMGLPMADIHAPVPGLNETLGRQIDGFLSLIKPGISWERANWGLSRTPELNLHPSRKLSRLDSGVQLDEVWFRLELQSLVGLPESSGILFGIRLVVLPMSQIQSDPDARQGMIRALKTMPVPMAVYKGIEPARNRLIELMEN